MASAPIKSAHNTADADAGLGAGHATMTRLECARGSMNAILTLLDDWDCWLPLALPRLASPFICSALHCRGSVASSSSSAPFGAPAVPELETLLLAHLDDAGVDGEIKDSMDWLTELGKPEQHEVTRIDRRLRASHHAHCQISALLSPVTDRRRCSARCLSRWCRNCLRLCRRW